MATLGSMIVNVLANTSGFHKAMNGVRGTLGSLQQAAGSVLGSVDALSAGLGAIGVGFSANAIIGELSSVADQMDNLAKVADRLGVSTEVFKGLEYGAGLAGVSSESLAGSLQFLSKQIGEAMHGGGKAKVVFDELGLSAERLSQMSADMQLRTIADELGGISDSAQRTRAALRLFGGDGAAMLNFLAEGEGAISSYMRQAERLGLTYSREEVAKVEAFNDAWETLTKTIGGITKDFVIDIAPAALEAVKVLQETIEGVRAIRATNAAAKPDPADQWMQDFATRSIGTGQASWLTSWFNKSIDAATRLRIGRDVAKENSVNNAFTAAELGANANRFGMFAQGVPGNAAMAAMNEQQLQRSMFGMLKKVTEPITSGGSRLQEGFKSLSGFVNNAKDFGAKWQRSWAFGEVVGRKGDANIDKLFEQRKLDKARQQNDFIKAFRSSQAYAEDGNRVGTANRAIQANTAEAFRAIAESRIQRGLLDQAKAQNGWLQKIHANLQIQTTGLS